DVGGGVRYVDLVEVDVVGLQAAQRVLDRGHDPAPRGALLIGIVAHWATELGRENDAVTTPFERLAHNLFRVAVGVGGVDEVDPRVQRFVDDADRVVVVGVADGRGEHQGAERVGADLDAGQAEGAVVHAVSPLVGEVRGRPAGSNTVGHPGPTADQRRAAGVRVPGRGLD